MVRSGQVRGVGGGVYLDRYHERYGMEIWKKRLREVIVIDDSDDDKKKSVSRKPTPPFVKRPLEDHFGHKHCPVSIQVHQIKTVSTRVMKTRKIRYFMKKCWVGMVVAVEGDVVDGGRPGWGTTSAVTTWAGTTQGPATNVNRLACQVQQAPGCLCCTSLKDVTATHRSRQLISWTLSVDNQLRAILNTRPSANLMDTVRRQLATRYTQH